MSETLEEARAGVNQLMNSITSGPLDGDCLCGAEGVLVWDLSPGIRERGGARIPLPHTLSCRAPLGPERFDKDGNEIDLPAWLVALKEAPHAPGTAREADEAMGIYRRGTWPAYTTPGQAEIAPPVRSRSPAQLASDARLRTAGPASLAKARCQRNRVNRGLPCTCGEH